MGWALFPCMLLLGSVWQGIKGALEVVYVNADLCLVSEGVLSLIGVCVCITDSYLCACIKVYSVSQKTSDDTVSWLGMLVNATHQSTELRFLKFEVSGTEHQISWHSPVGRSRKLKAMEATSLWFPLISVNGTGSRVSLCKNTICFLKLVL